MQRWQIKTSCIPFNILWETCIKLESLLNYFWSKLDLFIETSMWRLGLLDYQLIFELNLLALTAGTAFQAGKTLYGENDPSNVIQKGLRHTEVRQTQLQKRCKLNLHVLCLLSATHCENCFRHSFILLQIHFLFYTMPFSERPKSSVKEYLTHNKWETFLNVECINGPMSKVKNVWHNTVYSWLWKATQLALGFWTTNPQKKKTSIIEISKFTD